MEKTGFYTFFMTNDSRAYGVALSLEAIKMADDIEHKSASQPSKRKVSRRPVVVGLIGLATVEAVAGGISWKVLYQGLRKIIPAFAAPLPTPTPIPVHGTRYITYQG